MHLDKYDKIMHRLKILCPDINNFYLAIEDNNSFAKKVNHLILGLKRAFLDKYDNFMQIMGMHRNDKMHPIIICIQKILFMREI